jgi:Putative auto-transporter adhesin, head GIN domain
MKTNFPAVAALALAGIVFAAAAEAGTETRAVSDFEAIASTGSIDIVVRQGAKEAVTVTADDKLLPLIETVVEPGAAGRTLNVRLKPGERSYNLGKVSVVVDVVKLGAVTTSGSGDVVVEGLKTPAFKLTIAGSSDARLKALSTETLEVRISGSGDVLVGGTAKQVKLSIAGSGDANLADLQADDVQVRIAGSGDASVTANKSLDVSVAGSGDVRYSGSATAVKTSMAGSGTLSKR